MKVIFQINRGHNRIKWVPLTNRVKVRIYFYGITIEIDNFAFEVKVTIGLERTILNEVGQKGQTGYG